MWRWGGVVLGVFLWVLVGLSACSRTQYQYHVVRSGETLSQIGQAYRISYLELAELNGIRNPNHIQVGQRLRMPHGAVSQQRRIAKRVGQRLDSQKRPRTAGQPQTKKKPRPWQPGSSKARGTIPADPEKLLSWPLKGVLTSRFGPRKGSFHDGIDIAAPVGTPVRAAAAGRVIFSDVLRGYGNVVIVKHANSFTTVYAHHRRNLVKDGQIVHRGDIVGEVGQTGRVTGPSLHFEVRSGKNARDPMHYLPRVRHATQRR